MVSHCQSGTIALHRQLLNACVYVLPIQFVCEYLIVQHFRSSNLPLDEFGVKPVTFISEHRIVLLV